MSKAHPITISHSAGFPLWLQLMDCALVLALGETENSIVLSSPDGSLHLNRPNLRASQLYATDEDTLIVQSGYALWEFVHKGDVRDNPHDALYFPCDCRLLSTNNIQGLIAVDNLETCIYIDTESGRLVDASQPDKSGTDQLKNLVNSKMTGFAQVNDRMSYVAISDTAEGDTDHVYDLAQNEIVAENLTSPSELRWYNNRLWLLNTGDGEFGFVDRLRKQFIPIMFCPGYPCGLEFYNGYAFIAISEVPQTPLTQKFYERLGGKPLQSGVMIINLESGKLVHWIRLESDKLLGFRNIAILLHRFPLICPPDVRLTREKLTDDLYPLPVLSKKSRVSVIIPVYNGEDYIADAIRSVLSQTYNEFEIIVVNDGSLDDTEKVLQLFQDSIVYLHQPNQGVSSARNYALEVATGDIVAFLDADDRYYKYKLTDQLKIFDLFDDVSMVHSGWHLVDEENRIFGSRRLWNRYPVLDLRAWLRGIAFPASLMIRREAIAQVGGFRSQYDSVEDVDLVLRIALDGGQSAWLPKVTSQYRHHSFNATSNVIRQASLFDSLYDEIFKHPYFNKEKIMLKEESLYAHYLLSAYRLYQVKSLENMTEYLLKAFPFCQDKSRSFDKVVLRSFETASRDLPFSYSEENLVSTNEWQNFVNFIANLN